MSFLIFNDKTQEITIRSEMNRVMVIDALRSVDNSEDKSFFKEALKYIYHSYKKDHSFYNLSISERKIKTSEQFFNGRDCSIFENNDKVNDVVSLYLSLEYSQNEWTYEQLKNDIEDIKIGINKIPMKKQKVLHEIVEVSVDIDEEIEVKFDIPCAKEGEDKEKIFRKRVKRTIIKDVSVDINTEVDNSKERTDALKRVLELQELKEKFSEIIVRDKKLKEHNQDLTLLEQHHFKK